MLQILVKNTYIYVCTWVYMGKKLEIEIDESSWKCDASHAKNKQDDELFALSCK